MISVNFKPNEIYISGGSTGYGMFINYEDAKRLVDILQNADIRRKEVIRREMDDLNNVLEQVEADER
jgi:hypothetical protein